MKSKPKKLNVKLLRKIQKHITEEPRRFFMSGLRVKAKNETKWADYAASFARSDLSPTMPSCGTAACIAGWALTLSNKRMGYSALDRAGDLLGLPAKYFGYDHVFVADKWPEPFYRRWQDARTPKQRAKIACARIDHLIKTGE